MRILLQRLALLAAAVAVFAVLPRPATTTAQEGYRVIVNSANPAAQLGKEEVSRLLLKKQTSWSDGTTAEPVDLDGESAIRESLSRDIHGRSVSSIKNYWQRQIFSGRAVPPPEMASESAVIAFVGSRAGGIGYVSAGASLSGSVKVLRLVD